MTSHLAHRESPVGKRASLFVTCMVDMLYPQTGMSVVDVLEHVGVEVDFPPTQTCCGQPAFNSGYHEPARDVAKQFLRAFANSEVIVTPSGSCAAMVRHEYPALFADDPEWREQATAAAAKTWEITEYLVDGLGITDIGAKLPAPRSIAIHDACHGLRVLGLGKAGRQLLDNVENAEVHDLPDCDKCCGFGGLFSVKMPGVSGAMLERKMQSIVADRAEGIVTGDVSCMTHMNGGLSKQGEPKRVQHIIDVLAAGLPTDRSE
ncbi:MAG: (Fe-S)-binding protein [Phototrophicaceae bacterium]|jgi:L-lactate dehydrogenase complex protein LldE